MEPFESCNATAEGLNPIQEALHKHCVEHKLAYIAIVGGIDGTLYMLSNVPPQEDILLTFLDTIASRIRRGGISEPSVPKSH